MSATRYSTAPLWRSPLLVCLLVIPSVALSARSAPLWADSPDDATKATEVFLGNGIRNGWADQTSISLWTRTTARDEQVTDGPAFLELAPDLVRQLERSSRVGRAEDAERLLAAQLPAETRLEEMEGACPGIAGEVRLIYFPQDAPDRQVVSAWSVTTPENDFTHQWRLENLQPGTRYRVVVEARAVGEQAPTARREGGFQTAFATDQSAPLRFCMTTCHDYLRRDDGSRGHKIYPAMESLQPDFAIHAGDIEYYDKPQPYAWTIPLMRFKWARIFSLPSNREFYSRTTSYFLKDDHDTLKNDCWAGQRYGVVSFEQGVRLFNEEQFPSHTPRYKTVQWGRGLQLWLLEGRDYRSPNDAPDGPGKTILGETQKRWLLETLAASDADFKLVVSPTPIVGPDRKNKHDNYANTNFAYEGEQLRRELSRHDGVIVLCGDRHWQYASRDSETGLWEFGCGPGSEEHQLGWKQGDRRPQHEFLRVAGGFLSGQLDYLPDGSATLALRHRTVDGEPVSRFEFPQSER